MESYRQAVLQLPEPWAQRLLRAALPAQAPVTEIRLRSGWPPALTCGGRSLFLDAAGALQPRPAPAAPRMTHAGLQACFAHLCRYCAFAYEEQLRRGYLTLSGGHRVGVAAQAVYAGEALAQPRNISSLVIRVARRLPLAQPQLWQALLAAAQPRMLIAGPPGAGKTTVLRALVEMLSAQGRRVAVLDERCELFPLDEDGFSPPQPCNCDVLSGYPKAVGLQLALRALSPQVVACDELAPEEAAALVQGLNSGVGFLATVHAFGAAELQAKPQWRLLCRAGALHQAVLLQDGQHPGMVERCLPAAADAGA